MGTLLVAFILFCIALFLSLLDGMANVAWRLKFK